MREFIEAVHEKKVVDLNEEKDQKLGHTFKKLVRS